MESRENKPPPQVSAEAFPGPSWEECAHLLESLPSLSREDRVEAINRLVRNPSPGIRSRALHMGAALLSEDTLTAYLRNGDDDVVRNAGLEMLKMRGGRGFGLAVELLSDTDHDVALQAVLILDHLKDPRALEPLRGQLQHSDPNVQQAVISAIGRLGDSRAIRDLLPFLSADPWLQLATVEALGDIRSPVAVVPLGKLLTDLMIGPLVAEALARIGGVRAFRHLGEHWLRFEGELDPEPSVGLLAHVLEGLARAPSAPEGLRVSLLDYLRTGEPGVRFSAARCLLSLEPGEEDGELLDVLVGHHREALLLPACLTRRPDLIAALLAADDRRKAWGLLLSMRFPRKVPVEALAQALLSPFDDDWLGLVVEATRQVKDREVADALLNLYASRPANQRSLLAPALRAHRKFLKELLEGRRELSPQMNLVLRARLGELTQELIAKISALPKEARVETVAELADQPTLMRRLPWAEWLREAPEIYAALAVEAAVDGGLRELVPALRDRLREEPSPELIRAMGELGDRESVAILVRHLEAPETAFATLILESLGRIGGPEVRQVLRREAQQKDEDRARMAYRALSLCATQDDDEFFRQAIAHADWYVRLASVEVLGRFQRPENLAALAQLAADPSTLVAQRALALLEADGSGK